MVETDTITHKMDHFGLERLKDESRAQHGMIGFDTTEENLPPGYFHSSFFFGTMLAASLGLLAGVAGFGYAAPILADINAACSIKTLSAHILTTIFLTLVGRISDIFGRRWVFAGGSIVGLLGSVICAVSQDVPTLVGGTALIGIGASTQVSFPIVVGELLPMKYRFYGNALIFVFAIPGSGFGPAVANAFILYTSVGWRGMAELFLSFPADKPGVYYLLIAINGAAAICWIVFYHPPTFEMKHGSESVLKYVKDFDYIGTLLYSLGLLLFIMGLSWGGSVHPWRSAAVLVTTLGGVALLVAFMLWELYANLNEPLVPIGLFKNLPWAMSTVVLGVGAGMYYAFAIIWPSMVTVLYAGGDQMYGGWLASLVGLGLLAGEIVGGLLATPLGKTKFQMIGSVAAALILFASVATCNPDTKNRACALVFTGCFFVGWVENVCLTLTTVALNDQNKIGTAGGVAGSLRAAISAVSSAVYTAVLNNRLSQTIASEVPAALTTAGLPSSSVADFIAAISVGTPAAFAKVTGNSDSITTAGLKAYEKANSDAYRTVFLTTIAFSGLALVLSFFVPNVEDRLTGDVAATLHNRNDENTVGTR
ncbi:hypothetical protein FKW77_001054 [Venturia effusa]|uniref:Major facilitator superfamily (MFS) profile domain-containing protein n=1 Tax=Venturia effusa TaxID=50376 RepID=A0A517LJN4_9PEZI|nr:hypothetical protein FKW77_001054 [Venturia effusa]